MPKYGVWCTRRNSPYGLPDKATWAIGADDRPLVFTTEQLAQEAALRMKRMLSGRLTSINYVACEFEGQTEVGNDD